MSRESKDSRLNIGSGGLSDCWLGLRFINCYSWIGIYRSISFGEMLGSRSKGADMRIVIHIDYTAEFIHLRRVSGVCLSGDQFVGSARARKPRNLREPAKSSVADGSVTRQGGTALHRRRLRCSSPALRSFCIIKGTLFAWYSSPSQLFMGIYFTIRRQMRVQ